MEGATSVGAPDLSVAEASLDAAATEGHEAVVGGVADDGIEWGTQNKDFDGVRKAATAARESANYDDLDAETADMGDASVASNEAGADLVSSSTTKVVNGPRGVTEGARTAFSGEVTNYSGAQLVKSGILDKDYIAKAYNLPGNHGLNLRGIEATARQIAGLETELAKATALRDIEKAGALRKSIKAVIKMGNRGGKAIFKDFTE